MMSLPSDMSTTTLLIHLALMAGVTYLIRVLPLVLCHRRVENRFVLSFLHYIPYAVLSAMMFPSLFSATNSTWSAIAALVTGGLLAFLGRSMFVVAVSSCVAVYVVELALRVF